MSKLSDKIPVDKVYEDVVQPSAKEIGEILHKTTKVARFIFAPIEYVASYQKRWQIYLKRIEERVEPKNLIEGQPQIVLPVLKGLTIAQENSLLSEMFLNLLSNSVDATKQNLSHPSFPNLIEQLSHDEAVLLFHLKKGFMEISLIKETIEVEPGILEYGLFHLDERSATNNEILEFLEFPQNAVVYLNHLESLGVIVRKRPSPTILHNEAFGSKSYYLENYSDEKITLSEFGSLFSKSCIPDEFIF